MLIQRDSFVAHMAGLHSPQTVSVSKTDASAEHLGHPSNLPL